MEILLTAIQMAFPGTQVLRDQSDEVQTTLQVPGIPGYVRVMDHGITMTFNNTIPEEVAIPVLQAIAAK